MHRGTGKINEQSKFICLKIPLKSENQVNHLNDIQRNVFIEFKRMVWKKGSNL